MSSSQDEWDSQWFLEANFSDISVAKRETWQCAEPSFLNSLNDGLDLPWLCVGAMPLTSVGNL